MAAAWTCPAEQGFPCSRETWVSRRGVRPPRARPSFWRSSCLAGGSLQPPRTRHLLWLSQTASIFKGKKWKMAWLSQAQIPFAHWREVAMPAEPVSLCQLPLIPRGAAGWWMLFTPPPQRWPLIKLPFAKLRVANKRTQAVASNKSHRAEIWHGCGTARRSPPAAGRREGTLGPNAPAARGTGGTGRCSWKFKWNLIYSCTLGAGRALGEQRELWTKSDGKRGRGAVGSRSIIKMHLILFLINEPYPAIKADI